jgi:hypothetical protein
VPKFSAIVYAESADSSLLEPTLRSLQISDDVLLINADNSDEIRELGRHFHARMKTGIPGVTPGAYAMDTYHEWILVLLPGEAISDELRQSLTDWRRQKHNDNCGFRFAVLEHDGGNWRKRPPELRLVNRRKINWTGELPPNTDAPDLRGAILRYERETEERRAAS